MNPSTPAKTYLEKRASAHELHLSTLMRAWQAVASGALRKMNGAASKPDLKVPLCCAINNIKGSKAKRCFGVTYFHCERCSMCKPGRRSGPGGCKAKKKVGGSNLGSGARAEWQEVLREARDAMNMSTNERLDGESLMDSDLREIRSGESFPTASSSAKSGSASVRRLAGVAQVPSHDKNMRVSARPLQDWLGSTSCLPSRAKSCRCCAIRHGGWTVVCASDAAVQGAKDEEDWVLV
jgi:hypothetical protein